MAKNFIFPIIPKYYFFLAFFFSWPSVRLRRPIPRASIPRASIFFVTISKTDRLDTIDGIDNLPIRSHSLVVGIRQSISDQDKTPDDRQGTTICKRTMRNCSSSIKNSKKEIKRIFSTWTSLSPSSNLVPTQMSTHLSFQTTIHPLHTYQHSNPRSSCFPAFEGRRRIRELDCDGVPPWAGPQNRQGCLFPHRSSGNELCSDWSRIGAEIIGLVFCCDCFDVISIINA